MNEYQKTYNTLFEAKLPNLNQKELLAAISTLEKIMTDQNFITDKKDYINVIRSLKRY